MITFSILKKYKTHLLASCGNGAKEHSDKKTERKAQVRMIRKDRRSEEVRGSAGRFAEQSRPCHDLFVIPVIWWTHKKRDDKRCNHLQENE
jgi:hypothetical protein